MVGGQAIGVRGIIDGIMRQQLFRERDRTQVGATRCRRGRVRRARAPASRAAHIVSDSPSCVS
jgi:hypothetical protein